MKLIDILNEKQLVKLLTQYNYSQNIIIEQIESWKKALTSKKFTIPILGIQGAGKSSLLNALLMDDIILPVDSDETTCIPTEIVYSDENKKNAEILFLDGHTETAICSEAGLKPYVHQEKNTKNKKGVKCIRVFRNTSLLKNGVVLVDLPGVGSLTKGNIKTTMDYLSNSAGAIFLLRTIPPITNSESIFIKTAWPLLSKIFFVQNQWNDETTLEVNDGKDHNLNVLNNISRKANLSNSDVLIEIINVYKALTAKVCNDSGNLEKSGLNKFKNKIEDFVKTWSFEITTGIKENLELQIKASEIVITQEIESLEKQSSVLEKEYNDESVTFEEELEHSKKEYRKIKDKIDNDQFELSEEISNTIRISKENFRNSIRSILSKGVATDGSKLETVFIDIRNEQSDEIFGNIEPLFENFIEFVGKHLEEIPLFSFNKSTNDYSVGIDEKNHYESLFSKGGNAAGGIGGLFAGMALGAKIGARIGKTGGPWGTVIGATGGIIVGLLGSWLGGKAGAIGEEAIIKSRAENARKVIFPLIDKWADDLKNNLLKQLEKLFNDVIEGVDKWFDNTETEFQEKQNKLMNNLKKSDEEKKIEIEKLVIDKKALANYISLLRGANK